MSVSAPAPDSSHEAHWLMISRVSGFSSASGSFRVRWTPLELVVPLASESAAQAHTYQQKVGIREATVHSVPSEDVMSDNTPTPKKKGLSQFTRRTPRKGKQAKDETPKNEGNYAENEDKPFREVCTPMNWRAFVGRLESETDGMRFSHGPEMDKGFESAIEVLIEEPRQSNISEGTWQPHQDMENSAISTTSSTPPLSSSQKNRGTTPYRIRIRSPLLLNLINRITGSNIVIDPRNRALVFFRPFKVLVAYAREIREYLDRKGLQLPAPEEPTRSLVDFNRNVDNDGVKVQLDLLCKVLDEYFSPKILIRQKLDSSIKNVCFDDLWYIFKPGDEVRTPAESQIQLYRIIKVTGGREIIDQPEEISSMSPATMLKGKSRILGAFIIECFYIDYDGQQFGPVKVTFQIPKFEGTRDIQSLSLMPLDCDAEKSQTYQRLLDRGKRFTELAMSKTPAHKRYEGLSLGRTQKQIEGNVIIDFQKAYSEALLYKPEIGLNGLVGDDERELRCTECARVGCCKNDVIHDDFEIDRKYQDAFRKEHRSLFDITDTLDQSSIDRIRLLPYKLYGFILQSKRWDAFDIDGLSDVNYDGTRGWDDLVLGQKIKDRVLALVQNHKESHDSQDPTIKTSPSVNTVNGRGKGLVILLHGEPGVGKTSTAECVANHIRRPLFSITYSDIGDTAQRTESCLDENFQLAQRWGCVLLLDEADIFLRKRTNSDMSRNGIVSVFLRNLELYDGILFLTTNQVGTIDTAFKSRIHDVLYYPKLNKERTVKIWEKNLAHLKKEFESQGKIEGKDFVFEKEKIISFAQRHFDRLTDEKLGVWNGRQIRNAFQTAVAIAAYDPKEKGSRAMITLSSSQFKQVAKTAKEFDEYLKKLNQGRNDDDLAWDGLLRFDGSEDYKDHRASSPHMITDGRNNRHASSDNDFDTEADESSVFGSNLETTPEKETSQDKHKSSYYTQQDSSGGKRKRQRVK